MLLAVLNLFLSIALPIVLGHITLSIILQARLPILLRLSLSYAIGLGIIVLWMMLMYTLHFPITRISTSLPPLLILFAFQLWLARKRPADTTNHDILGLYKPSQKRNTSFIEKVLWACVALYIVASLALLVTKAMTLPIMTYDAMATVAYKAKLFFFEERAPSLAYLPHKTYPLLVAFSETWTAMNLGYWHDVWVKIVFPTIFISFVIVHYYFLKAYSNIKWALAGVALLLTSNFISYHATISYRDIHLMFYNCTAIMFIILWYRAQKVQVLFLAGLLAGIGSFTKLEGTAFLLIHAIIIGLFSIIRYRTNIWATAKHCLVFLIPSGLICGWYHYVKIVYRALKDGSGAIDKTGLELSFSNLALIPDVLQAYRENMLFTGNWNLMWLALLLTFAISIRKKLSSESYMLLISLILFFGLYAATAIFTTNYIWIAGHKNLTTLSRLFLHFFPLAVQYVILTNYALTRKESLT